MKRMLLNAKFLLEAGPIIVFFITYKLSQSNLILATSCIMGATLVCLVIKYILTKRISLSLMFSGSILLVAGGVTLVTGNTTYIKMKPTMVFTGYALAIYIGVIFKKFFIMDLVEAKHLLRLKHWRVLSLRVATYFLFLATLNEVTWRFFGEKIWVNFKIFGIFPLSFLFCLWQLSFISKNKSEG